ncbi:MAG: hypothetical protein E7264_11815 [Lachnospiraceae bacterium]|nr:hypothetical protein [Lachnospiraceae bacterium]
MAFYDWNQDGKKDWQDNYIEYNIYKRSTSNGNQSYSSGDGSSFKAFVAVVIFFLMVCGVVNLCTPKCIVDGCNSEREEGSSYCYYHKNSAVYKNHLKHSSRTSTYNSSSSARDTSTSTTSSTVSNKSSYNSSTKQSSYSDTKTSNSGTSSYSKKSSHSTDDDPYDVKSYSDAEDFYYDNYDDFWDYEEAEDYYNEYGE